MYYFLFVFVVQWIFSLAWLTKQEQVLHVSVAPTRVQVSIFISGGKYAKTANAVATITTSMTTIFPSSSFFLGHLQSWKIAPCVNINSKYNVRPSTINSRLNFSGLCVNKKNADNEATFEWVPPGTTKELAADYMKALPEDKQPIKGSAGAALRKQQLQKQLPLHDIDHQACVDLNDQEKQEFAQYLENLKSFAGQGKVSQVLMTFHIR